MYIYKFYNVAGVCLFTVFASNRKEAKEKIRKYCRREKILICKKA